MSVISEQTSYPDWVDAKHKEAYKSLFAQVYDFDKTLSSMVSAISLKGIRQYTGRGSPTLNGQGGMTDVDFNAQLGISPSVMKVAFNLTAAVIDTLTAKLASIEAVPQAVTFKGNVKGRKLADDLNFIIKGLFHKYDLGHEINLAFRDAMINRAGYLKVIKDDEKGILIDRVFVDEIIVDGADGYYNKPYKLIHRKAIPVHVLLKQYPRFKRQIEDCKIQEIRHLNTRNFTPCVTVVESWCLNTYIDGGRHVIAIETADLIDEDWDKDYFPILKVEYNEPAIGWMGQSVVDELDPIQKEIDRILMTMQAIMKIMSVPTWIVDTNSQMNKQHRTNKIGLIWEGDFKNGVMPVLHNGAAMAPELAQQLEFLIQQGYARVGLTPMDIQGQKPQGLDSGEALKTMTDIKSERWRMLQHNYEQAHIKLAEIILNELRGTNFKMKALDRYIGLKDISTRVIPKVSDSYVLKMFPVSSLPDTIPELIDSAQKMLQLGVIQPAQVYDLFKMPDLESYMAIKSAPRKLIEKKVEEMIETKQYWNPEPYSDLAYASSYATQMYNWAQLNDQPEDVQALLRKFIQDCMTLQQQVQMTQQGGNSNVNGTNPAPEQGPAQGGVQAPGSIPGGPAPRG